MKELIVALQACLKIAVSCGTINDDQADLVHDHILSLEDLTIRNEAMRMIRLGGTIPPNTAAGVLAKVCMMLTLYGSKPDAMLAVIHDKGWEVVTLEDVETVRKFILENS